MDRVGRFVVFVVGTVAVCCSRSECCRRYMNDVKERGAV